MSHAPSRKAAGDHRIAMSESTESHEAEAFGHRSVLLDPVVEVLREVPAGWVADCTVGGGGHAAALLEAAPHVSVLGIDLDGDARQAATARLAPFGPRAHIVAARFDALADVVRGAGVHALAGALFDLGVSSHQLDTAARGFSHRLDGPLDMRLDARSTGRTAAELVNDTSLDELTELLRRGGEDRNARRIAKAIVAARPVDTTAQLAAVVSSAIPHADRRRGGNPLNVPFQAIRIAVNEELDIIEPAVRAALDLLVVGGRLVVLSFHSGEDRIVKRVLATACAVADPGPRGLPLHASASEPPPFRHLRHVAKHAPPEEIARNRRAASVRMRAVQRVYDGPIERT